MITTLLSAHVLLLVGDFVVGSSIGEQKTVQCLLQVQPERPLPTRLKEVREDELDDAHEHLVLQSMLHAESKPKGPSKMHRTEMDQDDLAGDSRHVHKETYTSDWQDEYPLYAPIHHKVHPSTTTALLLPAKVGDAGMVSPAIGLIVMFLLVVACLVACMVCSRRKTKKHDDFVFGRNQDHDHGYTFHDVHHPVQYHDHQEQYMYHEPYKVHLEAHPHVHLEAHDEMRPPPENYTGALHLEVPSTSSHRRHSPEYTSNVYRRSHPQMVQEHLTNAPPPPSYPTLVHEHLRAPLPSVKESVTPPGSMSQIEGPLLPSTIPPEREREAVSYTTLPPAVEFHDAKADESAYPETSGSPTTQHPMGKSRGNSPSEAEKGSYYHEVAREYL